jgi:hypothetical protein
VFGEIEQIGAYLLNALIDQSQNALLDISRSACLLLASIALRPIVRDPLENARNFAIPLLEKCPMRQVPVA